VLEAEDIGQITLARVLAAQLAQAVHAKLPELA
jgi:hypothetical protein